MSATKYAEVNLYGAIVGEPYDTLAEAESAVKAAWAKGFETYTVKVLPDGRIQYGDGVIAQPGGDTPGWRYMTETEDREQYGPVENLS